ncbi:17243_t:CDS:2 [Gigaspora margarita]|uniref:17243_t:CDS:1 n=1 Tax=Gigaspora margarita TaxID=4874 RepID=A0ABN7V6R7_GIGMA|nr:17243_t:CDS:2 [Gigaspora margarita]
MDTNNLFETIPDNSTAESVTTTSDSVNIMPIIPTISKTPSTKLSSPVRPYFTQKAMDNKSVICSICKNSNWNLKKILLDICMLPYPHTGEEIDAKLHSVFAAFNITDKILCATTDRVRNFVNVISSSSSITQDFKELGQSVGEGEATHKIPQDVSTCWNSTYLMLSTYITMPIMISATIRRNKNLDKFKLTPQEEINLQATVQFLKPFYETTNVLSGSMYMILGISILLIDKIVDNISSCILNSESLEFLKTAATQMSKKIQKYANEIYDKTAFIAAILDPQIKLELILADINTETNCTIFNNIFRAEYATLILNNPSATYTFSTSSISLISSISLTSSTSSIFPASPTNLKVLSNLIYTEQIAQKKRKSTNSTNKIDKLTQYLSEAVLPININSLNWWKLNCTRFSCLSQMASDYLAIQSTSVPSKQVFSKADDTV